MKTKNVKNGTIDNWAFVRDVMDAYSEFEYEPFRINGEYNGKSILTSPIIKFDLENRVIETLNSIYYLGEPHQDFLKFLNDINKKLDDYISSVAQWAEDYEPNLSGKDSLN